MGLEIIGIRFIGPMTATIMITNAIKAGDDIPHGQYGIVGKKDEN